MTKAYSIDKNIDTVKNELPKITEIPGEDNSKKITVFSGKIEGNEFHFYCGAFSSGRDHTPELFGYLTKKDECTTKIEIDVNARISHYITEIAWMIIMIYTVFVIVPSQRWNQLPLAVSIMIAVITILFLPVMDNAYYFYQLRKMLRNIVLYIDGSYDKYIFFDYDDAKRKYFNYKGPRSKY